MAPDGRTEGRSYGHGQTYIPPPSAGDNNSSTCVVINKNLDVFLQVWCGIYVSMFKHVCYVGRMKIPRNAIMLA